MLYLRYLRLLISYLTFVVACITVYNYPLSIYLIKQGKGQLQVLSNTETFEEYTTHTKLGEDQKMNLDLIRLIKQYSVDSLGYEPTNNFGRIYDQKNEPILWVVTASKKYALEPVEWKFPLIGSVSYKGFFSKELALKEENKLRSEGYDVGIRSVSAWSTLGWFSDPILSSHLNRSKGSFCNLLFHELFHATFYEANNMNNNENLANFIAHKATLQFLKNDSVSYKEYFEHHNEREKLILFMNKNTNTYKKYLDSISTYNNRLVLKQKALYFIIKKLKNVGIKKEKIIIHAEEEILHEQNSYFIDYMQYNSKQDSLENAFNKFYKGSIKNMVRSLAP